MEHNSDTASAVRSLPVGELISHLRSASDKPEASIYCEELIRRFRPLIHRAWRRSGLDVEFADFLQDVLLRLFKSLPSLNEPKAFPGYFRLIVLSVAAEQARKQLKGPAVSSIDDADTLKRLVINIDDEILTGLFVRTYLELLNLKERAVLTLEFLEGYPTDRIANELGASPGTVRVIRGRALKKLRRLMLEDTRSLEKNTQ